MFIWGDQLCFAMKKATQSGLETCGYRHDSQLSSRSSGTVRPSDKPQLQRQSGLDA